MSTPASSAFPVRPPAVAGTWYPGEAHALAHDIETCLARVNARDPPPGRLVGLIVPHAGLRYSGPVAAHAYATLSGRRELSVVLVGPSHRAAFDGCAVFARGAWETPLGRVPIDAELGAALLATGDGLADAPRLHGAEHALEIQLPFLQHLVPGLRIVPVMMGSQTRAECEALALALVAALEIAPAEAGTGLVSADGREVLLVASSDLSHYHPAPAAHRLDALVLREVERLDAEGLMRRLEESSGHACGGGPIVSVMKASRALGATHATLLRYADSGDEGEHDKSRVVGYAAVALSAAP